MTLLNNAMNAYLTPLLEKHTENQDILYDDLMGAWQASLRVMQKEFDPAVSKQVRELHESQLAAYEDAARTDLAERIQSVSLPSPTEGEDEDVFVEKVVSSIEQPDWRVDNVVLEEAWMAPLRQKARVAFRVDETTNNEQEQGAAEENNHTGDETVTEEEADEDMEEGEEKTVKPKTKAIPRKRVLPVKTGKTALLKKKATTKAGTAVARANRGRRARRGGRGGNAAAKRYY